MNTIEQASILPGLRPVLSDLTERFNGRIEAVHVARPNEVYFHAQMELVPGFCAQLYKKWNGRLVSLFADDARLLGARPSSGAAIPTAMTPTMSGTGSSTASTPFPLTPALSLRERENTPRMVGESGTLASSKSRTPQPPLPKGEGRGEGEGTSPVQTTQPPDSGSPPGVFHLYYVFALDDAHGFLILRVPVAADHPQFISLTNALPAANWQEREVQDLFGIKLEGHPNPRRCALHDDWPEVYPLRKDFGLRTVLPAFQGERHKFREVEGEGVFQVPVGPVHAGIIEPGHFLFSVAGEPVLYLQIRLFYTHKGTEKLFENIPVAHGVRLAESISGDSSFAHATAFCHAVERAAGVEAPPRARALRTVCLELERVYNHIADIGAIATDVAFVVANTHAMRLQRASAAPE